MEKRLVTSALPYVNNIPHLGNLIQVLSADVFARFCRSKGYETLYICGTDEYGTATETKALAEGVSPRELCDKFHTIHKDIYDWFNISFDYFGRTSCEKQTEIVQSIFNMVDKAGYISEKSSTQLYCKSCDRFLADRYVNGTCPHCDYQDARGDQCEDCGKLLEPEELKNPRCGVCGESPESKETKHLYIDLPRALPLLEEWMGKASVDGFWAKNAIAMTKSWIRDGLKERCITRDLKWGIPVPKEGYENKVFYVWFDAPIGYISMTADYTEDWKKWWQNPEEVKLFQFIGKDNIPFHTVIFPSSLLATGEKWTMLHHMSSSEYLNYENSKFSKSKGTGVFGNDVQDTQIPADVWRFYIFYNRPEKNDVQFTWADFLDKVNGQLIGNLGNLINRTLTFIDRFFDGKVPEAEDDKDFEKTVQDYTAKITNYYEKAGLRDALRTIFELSSIGNKAFQDGEPWRTKTEAPEEAKALIRKLAFLIRDLGILISPVMPSISEKIGKMLGDVSMTWQDLGKKDFSTINKPEVLFKKLDPKHIEKLKEKYSGSQKDREESEDKLKDDEFFAKNVDLRVGKIIEIEKHPNAEKLYVEKIDLGNGEVRQIVSGLVDYYEKDELLGKNVIVVYNLKSAKLRGIKSAGMILAGEGKVDNKKKVEVLFTEEEVGSRVKIGNFDLEDNLKTIKIDDFFKVEITLKNNLVKIADSNFTINGTKLKSSEVVNGTVG